MRVVLVVRAEGNPLSVYGQIVEINEEGVVTSGPHKGVKLHDFTYTDVINYLEGDEVLEKVLKGEELSEKELSHLYYEYDDLCVGEEVGWDRRWSRFNTRTLNIFGRFFNVFGDIALTESGEDTFTNQPEEVLITPTREETVRYILKQSKISK